jgi:hypothetical protein
MRYDRYDCPVPTTRIPTRPPDPPSRIASGLWRRLREQRADPADVFERVVAAMRTSRRDELHRRRQSAGLAK